MAALLILYELAQKANYLEWRFYLFVGSLIGLMLYLFFFSRFITKIFKTIIELFIRSIEFVINLFKCVIHAIIDLLALLMSVPYGILRWFGLLLFRMSESLGKDSVTKVRGRIYKNPKE